MSDAKSIDSEFADFLGSLEERAWASPELHETVAQHTLEIAATMLAGAEIPEMQPVLVSHARSHGTIAVPATALRSEMSLAAGAAAALSHAAELDPIHAGTIICAAAVTVPAALAVAQAVEVSGPRYIAAVCAGYEAAIRLGRALDSAALLWRGWWPTALCGSFAAAVTSGLCLGLRGEALQDALGLAAVHSGGLALGGASAPVARNLLCAHAVRTGVEAALAARSGVAGPRELFSGSRNFLSAFARAQYAGEICAGLGERWAILETSLKRWPCALQAHSALDALDTLARRRADCGPCAADIQAVEIALPPRMQRIVDHPEKPATRWAAAASLQFLAAALLLDGDILEARLQAAGRCDPHVLELMSRIEVRADAALAERYPGQFPARVMLRDVGGDEIFECLLPPGHPERPLLFDASEARLRHHAAGRLSPQKLDSAVAFVSSLDRQHHVGPLALLLCPG